MAKLSGGQLAGGNSKYGREENDFYATNPLALEMLFEKETFDLTTVLEPCIGSGTLASVIKETNPNCKLLGVDLVDRGYPNTLVKDFLTLDIPIKFTSIITNPPYKIAESFIEKSMPLLTEKGKLAMFLKIQFLESEKRRKLFAKYPPKYIYVFTKRMGAWRDGSPTDPETGKEWVTTMCHAWFVWENGFNGEPIVRWL